MTAGRGRGDNKDRKKKYKETSFPSPSSYSTLNNPHIKLSAYKLQITSDSSGNMEARIGNRNGRDVMETIPTSPPTTQPPRSIFKQWGWCTDEDT
jgi:hypothetical protein